MLYNEHGMDPSLFTLNNDNSHYATSRKVAGSRPDEMDFFSNLPNPSGRTIALESTQPLTDMSIRNLKKKEKRNLGVKGGRRVGLTNLPPSVSHLSK
jgi:hypothetical protein